MLVSAAASCKLITILRLARLGIERGAVSLPNVVIIDVDIDVGDDFFVVDDFVEQCSLNTIVINIDNSRFLRLFNSIFFSLNGYSHEAAGIGRVIVGL